MGKKLIGLRTSKQRQTLPQEPASKQNYINVRDEAGATEMYCTNTDSILKFENKDKPMVIIMIT